MIDVLEVAADHAPPWSERDPATIIQVLLVLLKNAANEYDASVDDGHFVNPHEYRDARGFVLVASDLIASSGRYLTEVDADAYRRIDEAVETLARAMLTANPPMTPVVVTGAVYGAVSRVELVAGRYAN